MVNLHYENIELDYPREYFLQDVYYTLGEYYKYCQLVSKWMWDQDRLEKVTWKILQPSQIPNTMKNKWNIKSESKHTWIIIEAPDEKEFIDVIDLFCEADYILDVPEKGRGIKVLDADTNQGILLLENKPNEESEYLYLRPNDYVINQQRRAIQRLQEKPTQENRGLLRLFEESRRASWPSVVSSQYHKWEFLTNYEVEGTEEQRKFVEIALGTPDFAILEGPPGSGKTTTICELIIQEIRRDHRVLLCASTHVAVDNVLETLQEQGVTEDEVLAVRIGLERRISESVQDFQLQNRERKEKADLIKKLANINNRTESQQYLLDALKNSEEESIITRLILESANLVCGTTIGILQHPDIIAHRKGQSNSQGEPVVTPFDCLILDEASKTTFQEFLVPALYSRKWILVGDVQQLSPYVETTHIEDNIRSLASSEENARVCIDIFQSWYGSRRTTQGILIVDPLEPEKYCIQANKLGLNLLDLTKQDAAYTPWDILTAHVILVEKEKLSQIEFLPPDFIVTPPEAMTQQMNRRHEYWQYNHNSIELMDNTIEKSSLWAQNLAWRISRSFELRDNEEASKNYDTAIRSLLPQWLDSEELEALERDIDTIKRIALPSVLELLQKGFGRKKQSYKRGSSITDGMDPTVISERHIKLSYQHRMHPEISRFPRESIYNHQSLKDPRSIEEKRSWSYNRYNHRAGWIQTIGVTNDSNVNKLEADIIIEELESFLDWAKKNPKTKNNVKPWEVAVLTFYRKQESHLRTRIQKLTGTRFRSEFKIKDGSVKIKLCTVDRFQGHEADLVILSFVRNRNIGFLDSSTRLNVAITRARYQLLLVGNRRRFANQRRENKLKKLAENVPILSSKWAGRNS